MKVVEVKVDPGDALLIPGDIHCDKQDTAVVNLMFKVAQAAGVNHGCFVGDTFESAGISRHPTLRRKVKLGKGTIKAERKAAAPIFKAMRELCTGSKNVLTGNHEDWFESVQGDYPGFEDMEWWELYGDIFDGFTVREEHTALKYGPLLVCHGHRLRGSLSKYAAAAVLGNYPGQNTVFGHNHRLDSATTPSFKYGNQVWNGAWSVGHLKRRDIEITEKFIGPHSEKHQQGFGIATFFDRGKDPYGRRRLGFDMALYRIHRDTKDNPMVIYNGKTFK